MGNTWENKIWALFRTGELTRAFRDVLLCLAKFRGRGGIFPSHEAIAKRAKCCAKTVGNALKAARGLGIVGWIARRKPASWGTERTSNLYTLLVGNPGKPPNGKQFGVASQKNLFFLTASPDAADARASLARIREERTKKAAQEWLAGRTRGMGNAGVS